MNRRKLDGLWVRIEELRRKGGVKSSEMESFAQALGRKRSKGGKEPTWVSPVFPDLRPVSIPHHSKDLNRFTAGSILDQLEEDLIRHEEGASDG